MNRLIKTFATIMLALIGGSLFAYNGGYENCIPTNTVIGGVTYKGYGNYTVTKREESGTTISSNRYAQCKALKSVDLTGVTSIGDAAFAYSALESVTIPSTVSSLGYIAFGGCTNLTSVKFDESPFWTSGPAANLKPFCGCTGIKTVVVPGNAPSWDFDGMFSLDGSAPSLEVICPASALDSWSGKSYNVSAGYSVVYYLNEGTASGSMPTVAKCGEWFNVPAPTRDGCVFRGWQVYSGLSANAYYSVNPGEALPIESAETRCGGGYDSCAFANLTTEGTVYLSAIWEAVPTSYGVTYYLNDGAASGEMPASAQPGQWFAVPKPTRSGCVFKGWKVISGLVAETAMYSVKPGEALMVGSSETLCGAGVDSCSFANLTTGGSSVILSAIWEAGYEVEYYLNGGVASEGMPTFGRMGEWFTVLAPTREGCTFMGWRVISGLGAGALYSDYPGVANPISSSYVVCGRDIPSCSLANLSTEGHAVLSAVWAPTGCFKIEYDLRGGHSVGEMSDAVTFGTWAGIMAPQREGYVFAGWSQLGGYVGNGAMYSVTPGTAENITSESHVWAGGYDYCWVANLNGATGLVVLIANWTPVASCVAVAPGVSSTRSSTSDFNFTPGYYRGTFADDSGLFDLLVDEFDDEGVATIYFAATTEIGSWSAEGEATVAGKTLVLAFEQATYVLTREDDGAYVVHWKE